MAIQPGIHVGPYEILSAIGAGGMGEVYRARDSKLGRDVAIKGFARSACSRHRPHRAVPERSQDPRFSRGSFRCARPGTRRQVGSCRTTLGPRVAVGCSGSVSYDRAGYTCLRSLPGRASQFSRPAARVVVHMKRLQP